jgi:heterodisulfide reductase subunit C
MQNPKYIIVNKVPTASIYTVIGHRAQRFYLQQTRHRSQAAALEQPILDPTEKTATKIDPTLGSKLQKLGATRLVRCYNCGTCTAICPLSEENAEFPRTLIRYAIIGAEEKLLSSPGLWLCYYCGECSDSCPRDADPGAFLMAARRYATRQYSWGKIASVFYDNQVTSAAATVALTLIAIFGFLLMGNPTFSSPNLQAVFSFQILHDFGLVMGVLVGLSVLANVTIMMRCLHFDGHREVPITRRLEIWVSSLVNSVVKSDLAQTNYLKCTNRNRYLAHMALFWGFVGLAVATTIDFVIGLGKVPLYPVPPQRMLGILSGIAFTAGAAYYLMKRFKKEERHVKLSHLSDWTFVALMLLAGVSGLLLTLSMYETSVAAPSLYAIHLVVVFDLILLAPFTKFAHAIYRPLAIWINQAESNFQMLRAKEGVR